MKILSKMLVISITVLLLITTLSSCNYSYDEICQYMLYDRIVYNNTDYYLMDHAPDLKVENDNMLIIDQKVQVILVDENGTHYDSSKSEEAWTFVGKDEKIYIYFNSQYYTDDIAQASEYYDFEKP